MLFLDSTFCIDLLRGEPRAKARGLELDASREQLALAAPSIPEFLAVPLVHGGERLKSALELVARCEVVPVDDGIGMAAAHLGGECLRRGAAVGSMDLVIAATAIHHRAAVLTRDPDFPRIPGVMVQSY